MSGGIKKLTPWVLVSGGVHGHGGMDRANLALAEYLLQQGKPTHIVTHYADPLLAAHPLATVHLVPRPVRSYFLGQKALARRGMQIAQSVSRANAQARVVVNGGNCMWPGINWAHYVHHAWTPAVSQAPLWFRAKTWIAHQVAKVRERQAFRNARLVVANSEMTRRHLIECLALAPDRVRTIYLGSDPDWGQITREERDAARATLGVSESRRIALFVGAMGYDQRKGQDLAIAAWGQLCADPAWDVDLLVAGGGRAVEMWRSKIRQSGLADRIRVLGFSTQVRQLLAAADILISPVRYEPYGLNVQEAICRGLPAIVTVSAGVAERYTDKMAPLLMDRPGVESLVSRIRWWRENPDEWKCRFQPMGEVLRNYSWAEMSRNIVAAVEEAAHARG